MGDYADGSPYGGHPGHRAIVQADEGTGGIMSDTPRTDAFHLTERMTPEAVEFSRELERELAKTLELRQSDLATIKYLQELVAAWGTNSKGHEEWVEDKAQVTAYAEGLLRLLKLAACPDEQCGGKGWKAQQVSTGVGWEQQQCRFCFERNLALTPLSQDGSYAFTLTRDNVKVDMNAVCVEGTIDMDVLPMEKRGEFAVNYADSLAVWCNALRPALVGMMQSYERRVRSECSPEQLAAKPWECSEFIIAQRALDAQPRLAVDVPACSEGELTQDAKDAARYRWLCNHMWPDSSDREGVEWHALLPDDVPGQIGLVPRCLNDAVDTAMRDSRPVE